MVPDMERFWKALTMYEGTKSWTKWLVVEPSLEQELQLETDSRAVLEDEDHERSDARNSSSSAAFVKPA